MAGLVKLNDPAGELSANYALQRQKNVYVAIGAAEFRIWDAIRASKKQSSSERQKQRGEKSGKKGAEEQEEDEEEGEEKALA